MAEDDGLMTFPPRGSCFNRPVFVGFALPFFLEHVVVGDEFNLGGLSLIFTFLSFFGECFAFADFVGYIIMSRTF